MAVIRPGDLFVVDVKIEFNFEKYSKLEIDFQHINRGKGFTRDEDFSIETIVKYVTMILDKELSEAELEKEYGDESCEYFTLIKNIDGKNFKLVFCICTDRLDTLGIITLYRLRR